MSNFKIYEAWLVLNKTLEKAIVEIDSGLKLTIEPFTNVSVENSASSQWVRMIFEDELQNCSSTWEMTQEEFEQLTSLFNKISTQMKLFSKDATSGGGSCGCTRTIKIIE